MNRSVQSRGRWYALALVLCLSVAGVAQATGEVTVWAKLEGAQVDVRVVARIGTEV